MSTVTLVFARSRRPDSYLLRAAMWSRWSHVGLVMPGGKEIIDATFFHDVSKRPLSDLLTVSSNWKTRKVECPNPRGAYEFARSQIGKKYDTLGVIGIGLHRDWQSDENWFCSEFVEACLAAGGNKRFINGVHRVTPAHSWMVR